MTVLALLLLATLSVFSSVYHYIMGQRQSVIEMNVFIVTVFPLLQDENFPVQNSLRDQDPSCKTDLDLWDCFERENSILPRITHDIFALNFERVNSYLI